MADKVTTTYQLKFEWLFVDGDTRTLTLQNPKETIQTNEITELENLILNAQSESDPNSGVTLLIGDKTSADFRRINMVTKETVTKAVIDLS